MEEEHQRISNDEEQKIDLEPTPTVDVVDQGLLSRFSRQFNVLFLPDLHDLSITPIPETFHDEDETTKSEVNFLPIGSVRCGSFHLFLFVVVIVVAIS